MDRSKFVKVCETVMRKSAGKSNSEVAAAIADALELVLEMEGPDLDILDTPIDLAGIVASGGTPKPTEPPSLGLPHSPAVQPAEKRLIVTPSEASATLPQRVAPIKMNRAVPEDAPGEDLGIEYWTVPTLVAELHTQTPEQIEVQPYGTDAVVVLQRDILADHVLKAAKLVYTLASLKPTQPWVITPGERSIGQAAGEPPAMSIDLPVFRDFFTTDKDLKLPEKIDGITEDARKVYAPRQKEIHSSTPRRTGPIRFDPTCPHAEADVLQDQMGRQY